jgi:transcriptional regulator with XRE-family HTH domain
MFGERLKETRIARGLSQADLAQRLGMTRQQISQLEKADNPTSDVLSRIAKALEVSTDYLLGFSDKPQGIASFTPDEMEAILLDAWHDPKFRPLLEALITITKADK